MIHNMMVMLIMISNFVLNRDVLRCHYRRLLARVLAGWRRAGLEESSRTFMAGMREYSKTAEVAQAEARRLKQVRVPRSSQRDA